MDGEREADCPDEEGDDLLVAEEAQDSYGETILDLAPYPTVGAQGELDWNLTLSVDPAEMQLLNDRVVVLYGKTADRESTDVGRIYQPELPVACGTIRAL